MEYSELCACMCVYAQRALGNSLFVLSTLKIRGDENSIAALSILAG